uniref:Uncharacterized protein n=1 Tax=Globisporangium ultimum (strain ATCC 200006 / CBS 805.95 / DAOM BR144) TaxID=431595 RepID=K3WXW9_GLOUD
MIGVSRDAVDLERALAACAQHLQQAQKQLVRISVDAFHANFLEVLRSKYDAFVRDMRHPPAVARSDPAHAASALSSRDRWSKRSLQTFLGTFFAVYETPEPFDSLWTLLLPHRVDAPHQHLDLSKTASNEEDEYITISFETLKDALKRHATDRLLKRDPFPLEPERFLDANYCKRKAGHEDELELPKLQTAVPKRSSLPTPSRLVDASASGRHSTTAAAISSSSAGAAPRKDVSYSGSNSTPLLQDFHAEVMKKSRNWLGRWQTRYMFLRWNELEICKKNISAHRSGPMSGVPASPSGSLLSSASANAAKSKRYPLQTLLSLQIVQLNESDPSKKQAISLHFKHPTANGGNTTKSLILGCDSSDHLKSVVIQIATFALFYGLATGQDVPSLQKFIQVGANLDVYCAVPSPNVPPFPLSPLQLAFLQSTEWKPASFEATVQLLVRSGADPRSILRWNFATHVLFSSAYGADGEMSARRLLMVRQSIDGVVFPFGGVISDDEYQWNLLMYFCCYGDLDGARQLLTTFSKISKSKCLKYVDHVNAAGDNALHIAIKTSQKHANSEELAMLLVDVGTGNATFITTTASGTTGGEAAMTRRSVVPSLSSSSSYVDSQLVHCCDGNGETVFHLALKARLWCLVDKLVDCKATDPTSCDRHGNTSLHLAIKVGAPVHTIARIIQLYRPNRSSAFNSVSSERSQLVTTLGYESRERHGNDTPLTLAIKYRQEEVVELLLSAGATASAGDCLWSLATVPLEPLVHDPQLQSHGNIGDVDSALHVAIKAGLQHAAAALVAKDANMLLVDSNGASALALAIRYGMYELSVKIAEKVAGADTAVHNREQKQWIDQETGAPVCILAIKAGQIELAALLLDISNNQMTLSHLATKETLLHILVKNISWLECSGVSGNKTENNAQQAEGTNDTSIAFGEESFAKRTRSRVKSRSDGDLRYLRMPGLDVNLPSSTPAMTSPPTSTSSDASADAVRIGERIDFFQQVEEALILGILQRSNDCSVVALATKHQPVHSRSSFHLATSPSVVVTDHNVDSYTPLHVAAAGGNATSNVLGLFLAYLYVKSTPSRLEMAEILAKTTGSHAENPLHAALGSNSSYNGLQILYALQLARGKRDLLPVQDGSTAQAAGSDTLQDRKRINSICSQILEAATVPNGSTSLHLSCRWPQSVDMLHVTDLLLQEDVYAGCWDSDGVTPLHVGVLNNCDKRLIQLFKRHHQDLNLWTEGKGRSRILRSLSGVGSDNQLRETTEHNSDRRRGSTRTSDTSTLSNGERAGTEPSTPKTALMLAIEYENAIAFHELVRCGAQLRVVTPRSRLGLLHFAAYNKLQSKELLFSPSMMSQTLLD